MQCTFRLMRREDDEELEELNNQIEALRYCIRTYLRYSTYSGFNGFLKGQFCKERDRMWHRLVGRYRVGTIAWVQQNFP